MMPVPREYLYDVDSLVKIIQQKEHELTKALAERDAARAECDALRRDRGLSDDTVMGQQAELDEAWRATGVAGEVRGLTTLADVVATHRRDLSAVRARVAELEALARRAVDGLSKGACLTCGAEPGCNIDCPGCKWVSDAEAALAKGEP